MSITEHRRMVENIDRKMRQLNMDAFYMEYDGFFRFAKTLETLAISISENKAKAQRKENEIAKAIDVRVHQLGC